MLSRLPQESEVDDHGFTIKKEGRNVTELDAERCADSCRPCGGNSHQPIRIYGRFLKVEGETSFQRDGII